MKLRSRTADDQAPSQLAVALLTRAESCSSFACRILMKSFCLLSSHQDSILVLYCLNVGEEAAITHQAKMSTLKTIFIFCWKTYFKMYQGTNVLLDKHTKTLQLRIQTDQATFLLQNAEGFWLRFTQLQHLVCMYCIFQTTFEAVCMHACMLLF